MFGDKPEFSFIFFTQHVRGASELPSLREKLVSWTKMGVSGAGLQNQAL